MKKQVPHGNNVRPLETSENSGSWTAAMVTSVGILQHFGAMTGSGYKCWHFAAFRCNDRLWLQVLIFCSISVQWQAVVTSVGILVWWWTSVGILQHFGVMTGYGYKCWHFAAFGVMTGCGYKCWHFAAVLVYVIVYPFSQACDLWVILERTCIKPCGM